VKKISKELKKGNNGLMIDLEWKTQKFALKFLHEMDYSLIRAKFYILFPSFWKFRGTSWTNGIQLTD